MDLGQNVRPAKTSHPWVRTVDIGSVCGRGHEVVETLTPRKVKGKFRSSFGLVIHQVLEWLE